MGPHVQGVPCICPLTAGIGSSTSLQRNKGCVDVCLIVCLELTYMAGAKTLKVLYLFGSTPQYFLLHR